MTTSSCLSRSSASIASSKVKGLQGDARDLASSEARTDTGAKHNLTTAEVLANIDATELTIEAASSTDASGCDQIVAIHRQLMIAAPNASIAGRLRTLQNWIGGDDYNRAVQTSSRRPASTSSRQSKT